MTPPCFKRRGEGHLVVACKETPKPSLCFQYKKLGYFARDYRESQYKETSAKMKPPENTLKKKKKIKRRRTKKKKPAGEEMDEEMSDGFVAENKRRCLHLYSCYARLSLYSADFERLLETIKSSVMAY